MTQEGPKCLKNYSGVERTLKNGIEMAGVRNILSPFRQIVIRCVQTNATDNTMEVPERNESYDSMYMYKP